ncbi:unnamed protein product [Chrysodeixis includens]|uniref:Uncharacterized protein n=1 Tax=Chrysodeixis includens TaxID=689277 RepID=A0A9P0BYH5_CHRIL|nr:unnamed protein product [Chrysodeixis includens]
MDTGKKRLRNTRSSYEDDANDSHNIQGLRALSPLVYTTRLEEMDIFQNLQNKKALCIYYFAARESKPTFKHPRPKRVPGAIYGITYEKLKEKINAINAKSKKVKSSKLRRNESTSDIKQELDEEHSENVISTSENRSQGVVESLNLPVEPLPDPQNTPNEVEADMHAARMDLGNSLDTPQLDPSSSHSESQENKDSRRKSKRERRSKQKPMDVTDDPSSKDPSKCIVNYMAIPSVSGNVVKLRKAVTQDNHITSNTSPPSKPADASCGVNTSTVLTDLKPCLMNSEDDDYIDRYANTLQGLNVCGSSENNNTDVLNVTKKAKKRTLSRSNSSKIKNRRKSCPSQDECYYECPHAQKQKDNQKSSSKSNATNQIEDEAQLNENTKRPMTRQRAKSIGCIPDILTSDPVKKISRHKKSVESPQISEHRAARNSIQKQPDTNVKIETTDNTIIHRDYNNALPYYESKLVGNNPTQKETEDSSSILHNLILSTESRPKPCRVYRSVSCNIAKDTSRKARPENPILKTNNFTYVNANAMKEATKHHESTLKGKDQTHSTRGFRNKKTLPNTSRRRYSCFITRNERANVNNRPLPSYDPLIWTNGQSHTVNNRVNGNVCAEPTANKVKFVDDAVLQKSHQQQIFTRPKNLEMEPLITLRSLNTSCTTTQQNSNLTSANTSYHKINNNRTNPHLREDTSWTPEEQIKFDSCVYDENACDFMDESKLFYDDADENETTLTLERPNNIDIRVHDEETWTNENDITLNYDDDVMKSIDELLNESSLNTDKSPDACNGIHHTAQSQNTILRSTSLSEPNRCQVSTDVDPFENTNKSVESVSSTPARRQGFTSDDEAIPRKKTNTHRKSIDRSKIANNDPLANTSPSTKSATRMSTRHKSSAYDDPMPATASCQGSTSEDSRGNTSTSAKSATRMSTRYKSSAYDVPMPATASCQGPTSEDSRGNTSTSAKSPTRMSTRHKSSAFDVPMPATARCQGSTSEDSRGNTSTSAKSATRMSTRHKSSAYDVPMPATASCQGPTSEDSRGNTSTSAKSATRMSTRHKSSAFDVPMPATARCQGSTSEDSRGNTSTSAKSATRMSTRHKSSAYDVPMPATACCQGSTSEDSRGNTSTSAKSATRMSTKHNSIPNLDTSKNTSISVKVNLPMPAPASCQGPTCEDSHENTSTSAKCASRRSTRSQGSAIDDPRKNTNRSAKSLSPMSTRCQESTSNDSLKNTINSTTERSGDLPYVYSLFFGESIDDTEDVSPATDDASKNASGCITGITKTGVKGRPPLDDTNGSVAANQKPPSQGNKTIGTQYDEIGVVTYNKATTDSALRPSIYDIERLVRRLSPSIKCRLLYPDGTVLEMQKSSDTEEMQSLPDTRLNNNVNRTNAGTITTLDLEDDVVDDSSQIVDNREYLMHLIDCILLSEGSSRSNANISHSNATADQIDVQVTDLTANDTTVFNNEIPMRPKLEMFRRSPVGSRLMDDMRRFRIDDDDDDVDIIKPEPESDTIPEETAPGPRNNTLVTSHNVSENGVSNKTTKTHQFITKMIKDCLNSFSQNSTEWVKKFKKLKTALEETGVCDSV